MAVEIERKFLVADERWRRFVAETQHVVQAYLAVTEHAEIRVRIVDGREAMLTVKSVRPGLVRTEYEIALAPEQARSMIALRMGSCIEKRRHRVKPDDGRIWEIDEFLGEHAGLVIAEVELRSPDEVVERFAWLGREVTGERHYYNAALAGLSA